MNTVWREHFRIHFYDVEPNGRASVPALCRYLEEAANSQTERLGISLRQVRESNRMWVLTRFSLKIAALPKGGETIAVETWASDRTKGIRAYRDFRLRDASGAVLAEASSLWLLLDAETRRPLRLPDLVLQLRHAENVCDAPVDAEPLFPPEAPAGGARFKVHWGDLDANEHANNLRYIEWALDGVPLSAHREATPSAFDIQFMSEVLVEEEIVSAAVSSGGHGGRESFRHSLRVGERVLAIARSDWRRPEQEAAADSER